MTEELKQEAEESAKKFFGKPTDLVDLDNLRIFKNGYLAGAEPREKRIEELEMTVGSLRTFSNEQATCIERLEAQIEKMKNCKNCANYMISGKCPSFFRTGWCKNWEMTRSKK